MGLRASSHNWVSVPAGLVRGRGAHGLNGFAGGALQALVGPKAAPLSIVLFMTSK
jgi:hypothetical protein